MTAEPRESKEQEITPAPGDTSPRVYNPVDETEQTVDEMRIQLERGLDFSNRVQLLTEVALQIDSCRSRDDIVATLIENVPWLINHEVAFLALATEERTGYVLHPVSEMAHTAKLSDRVFPVSRGTAGWVIDRKRRAADEVALCPGFDNEIEGILLDQGERHLLCVPLQTTDTTIGALMFSTTRQEGYYDQEIWIAQLLAMHTAIALKNLHYLENTRKRLTQIDLVNEIAEKLTSTLELNELLNSAAEAIQKTCQYFDVTIFMVDDTDDSLVLVAHSGNYLDFLPKGYRQPKSEGVAGWVASTSEKVLVSDVGKDERYIAYEYHNTQSELAVPIRIEGKVVGVVNVEDTKLNAFDETDATVLETVCDQLGSFIKNAQLYEEVRKSNETLTELNRMKMDFLGIVSHDFRTPLASISLAARAMAKRGVTLEEKRREEYLGIIVDQAEKLSQLAEDTLSITKLEVGQLSYHFEIVNVERLLKDAIGLVHFSRRHVVEPPVVDTHAAYIYGDQTKLRQLVHNLLSNAVKYSPQGGIIRVVAEPYANGRVLISVSDEGIGIPTDQVGRLFQKFSRVDTPAAREIKGSGLGLWICAEIVKGHGGEIWVDTEPGKGSRFMFTLKADQDQQ